MSRGFDLIAGFDDKSNYHSAATGTVDCLLALPPKPYLAASMPCNGFYHDDINRMVALKRGRIMFHDYPETEFYLQQDAKGRLFLAATGVEPDCDWDAFADAFVGVARCLGTERLFVVTANAAEVPHTREPPLYKTFIDKRFSRTRGFETADGLQEADISTVLIQRAHMSGIPAFGIAAQLPYYYAISGSEYNTKGVRAVLSAISRLTGLEFNLSPFERANNEMDACISETVRMMDIGEHIRELEEAYDARYAHDLGNPAEILTGVEKYLRELKQ